MQCSYMNSNNTQCQAHAMKDGQFCFRHNPEMKEKQLAASAKGGTLSRRDHLNMDPRTLRRPEEVVILLEEVINGVRAGTIPPQLANTLAYVASHLLRAMESAQLDGRLEIVESILMQRKTVKKGR